MALKAYPCQSNLRMPNLFYHPGDQRAGKVDQLFTRIASRYDLINDLQSFGLHRRWKRRLVRLARVEQGCRVLDVCCGTGDLTFAFSREGAAATGLDFNSQMLAVAHRRMQRHRWCPGSIRPQFVQGDALQLPFPEHSFDIVSVGYGLRNLASWEAGLREMLRVARPGGRLLVLDFGKPPGALWRNLYFGYLRLVVPILGLAFCGSASAYAYILESLKHFPAQRGVSSKMHELGLSGVQLVELLGGMMSINYGEKGYEVPGPAQS
jgi:demethylmenaquinone methyltransferase/2-methoxy-6-polyprenyl-1,4-benzoquinol methylase